MPYVGVVEETIIPKVKALKGFPTLAAVKLLHTAVWAVLAVCIVALPVAALTDRFDWAVALTLVVFLEGVALVLNGGQCPVTSLAARYTDDRADNFDIYLPPWLALRNKTIFCTLFISGELVVLWRWLAQAGT